MRLGCAKLRAHPLESANFTFEPQELGVIHAKTYRTIQIVLPHCDLQYSYFNVTSADERVFIVSHDVIAPNVLPNMSCYSANVTLHARNIGITRFNTSVVYPTPNDTCYESVELKDSYDVNIQRAPGLELLVRLNTASILCISFLNVVRLCRSSATEPYSSSFFSTLVLDVHWIWWWSRKS